MSGIFPVTLIGCCAVGLLCGRGEELGAALLDAGNASVQMGILLAGAYGFWCGMLKVLERSGATDALARGLEGPVKWLLGTEGEDTAVRRAVCLNFTANALGLGNAATPAGLEAMRLMKKHSVSGVPSHGMCMFLLVNASSLQIVPTTVISLRAAMGAAEPAAVFWPALAGSAAATVCAVALGMWMRRQGERSAA